METQKVKVEQIQFGLSKSAGWCHNSKGDLVIIDWLTIRATHDLLPGGTHINCEYKDGKIVRYLGSSCFASDTSQDVLDGLSRLATWEPYKDNEFEPQIFVAERDSCDQLIVTIVAHTEHEAAKAAAYAGYYVNKGKTYPGMDKVPHHKGAAWRKLAFGEFEFNIQHPV